MVKCGRSIFSLKSWPFKDRPFFIIWGQPCQFTAVCRSECQDGLHWLMTAHFGSGHFSSEVIFYCNYIVSSYKPIFSLHKNKREHIIVSPLVSHSWIAIIHFSFQSHNSRFRNWWRYRFIFKYNCPIKLNLIFPTFLFEFVSNFFLTKITSFKRVKSIADGL